MAGLQIYPQELRVISVKTSFSWIPLENNQQLYSIKKQEFECTDPDLVNDEINQFSLLQEELPWRRSTFRHISAHISDSNPSHTWWKFTRVINFTPVSCTWYHLIMRSPVQDKFSIFVSKLFARSYGLYSAALVHNSYLF